MAGQEGDTCREENNAERDLFLHAGLHRGLFFCLEPTGGDSGVSFKMCWSAVMVSSNQSLRIPCCNREYCLCWEMDFDIHFANAFAFYHDSVIKILNSSCCRTVGIIAMLPCFFIFGTEGIMFFLSFLSLYYNFL